MAEVVVKHFRRSESSSGPKELVTEIVSEDSKTGKFLNRMDESRLTRPCFQTIDMRGRVAGECSRYAFNDRIHFLDDISFQMFEQGARENRGVYTVGTFEAIMGGSHTLAAQKLGLETADRQRLEVEKRRQESARAAIAARSTGVDAEVSGTELSEFAVEIADNPEHISLGYFRQQVHPRLQYACPVSVERGNIKSAAVTRDISISGIQVQIKGLTTFRVGQDVLVSFDTLVAEADGVEVRQIAYKIVAIDERENESILRLNRKYMRQPRGFTEFIEDLIERYQSKYKLDVDDEYQSVLSWCYERYYAESATQIPLFVEQTEAGDLRVQAVAMCEGNTHLAHFFCTDEDNYNFTPLCLPSRLDCLYAGSSFVLAMYRKRGEKDRCMRIHSLTDFETTSPEAFKRFLSYAMQQPEHCIVKVSVGSVPLVPLADTKISEVSERLKYKSETRLGELQEQLGRLMFVASLTELTQDMRGLIGDNIETESGKDLSAWVGTEFRDVETNKVKDKLDIAAENLHPELIRFGYVERRREDRYLAETAVEVRIEKKVFKGTSRDISTRGMRIALGDKVNIKVGSLIKVGLTSLQKKKSSTNLSAIPYRIVHVQNEDKETVLMMERVLGKNQEGLKEFFVELITKNQHKLGVDTGDIWSATASRVYESLFATNTPSLPFFLGRSEEGGAHLQFVGVPQNRSMTNEFFFGAGGYDFRTLNERRLVRALYDAIQILTRQSKDADTRPVPFELLVYAYKEYDEPTGETFLHMATSLDFPNEATQKNFEAGLSDYMEWRCFKMVSTFTQPLAEKALTKMIDPVRAQSKHRAVKLSDLVHSLVGYAELIDITEEFKTVRS